MGLSRIEGHTRSAPSSACCSSCWMRSRSCRSFAFFSFITAANWHTRAGSVAEAHMQPTRPCMPPCQAFLSLQWAVWLVADHIYMHLLRCLGSALLQPRTV